MSRSQRTLFGAALGFAVLGLTVGVLTGTEDLSLGRALGEPTSLDRSLMMGVRLPRALLAACVGGGLGITGAALQSLLRNPLAEPYVLGVSGGAALGATVALLSGVVGLSVWGSSLTTLAAFVGGMLATALLWPLLRRFEGRSTDIILAGVVINATASALITFAKTLVSAAKAQELLFWLTGFLDVPTYASLGVVSVTVVAGAAVLLVDARSLEVLGLGEASARSLGVRVGPLVVRTLLASSLITAAVVSTTGLIGFVGLLMPHAARGLGVRRIRPLLLVSACLGSGALVLFDAAARVLFRWFHTEVPAGALTALVGGPAFMILLVRNARRAA